MKRKTLRLMYILSGTTVLALILALSFTRSNPEKDQEPPADSAEAVGFLTSMEIPVLLANGRPTMIEFGGRTCIPCKQMQPILAELKSEYSEVIDIVNFYLEDDYSVASTFQITLMPTQIVFGRGGKELTRHVGIWPKESIVEEYQRLGIIP